MAADSQLLVLVWNLVLVGAACIGVILGGLVALYAAYIHYKRTLYDHIPGPKRESFWLGNGSMFIRGHQRGSFVAQIMLECVLEYGLTFKLCMWHKVFVFTADPDTVKDLLATGSYRKSPNVYGRLGYLFGERCLGTGLVTEVDHETWAWKRALMNPAFRKQYLRGLIPQFNHSADCLMQKLAAVADGRTQISMLDKLSRLALDLIGEAGFGQDIDSLTDIDNPFPSANATILKGVWKTSMNPLAAIDPRERHFRREVRDAIRLIRRSGAEWITERKKKRQAGETVPDDILSHIVQILDEDPEIGLEDILDDFVTFFFAGQETTANAMSFIVMELGRHPDVLERVREEVDRVVGSRPSIGHEDIAQMHYLDMVIKETLRLYPVATGTVRYLDQPGTVGGYLVPAHTDISLSTYVSSRLPQFFDNPLQFDPDRFVLTAEIPNVYAYYPFIIGPRNCIGQNFARMEMKVIVSKFVQRFDFQLDPDQSFDIKGIATLSPKGGVMCTLTVRG